MSEHKLFSNSTYMFGTFLVLITFSIVFWWLAGKTLNPYQYGQLATSIAIITLLSVIGTFGIQNSLPKMISEYFVSRPKAVGDIIFKSLKIIFVVHVFLFLFFYFLSNDFSALMKIPLETYIASIVIAALYSLAEFTQAVLFGLQKMKKVFLTISIGNLLKIISISALILFFSNSRISYFLFGLAISLLLMFAIRFEKSWLSYKEEIDAKSFFRYSLTAFIAVLAWNMFFNSNYIILSILKDPAVTGIFAMALVFSSPIVFIPNVLSAALVPITSELSAKRNQEESQRKLLELSFRYSMFLAIPMAAFLTFFSRGVILFFGKEDFFPAEQLFPYLAIGSLLLGTGYMLSQNIYAIKRPETNMKINLLVIAVYLSLSIFLGSIYSGWGVAIAYLLSASLFFFLSYVRIRKFIGFSIGIQNVLKIILATAVYVLPLYGVFVFTENVFIRIAAIAVAGVLYLLSLLLLKFYNDYDLRILKLFSKLPAIGFLFKIPVDMIEKSLK